MFLNSALLSENLSIGAKLIMWEGLISTPEIEGVCNKQKKSKERTERKEGGEKCNVSVFLLNVRE